MDLIPQPAVVIVRPASRRCWSASRRRAGVPGCGRTACRMFWKATIRREGQCFRHPRLAGAGRDRSAKINL